MRTEGVTDGHHHNVGDEVFVKPAAARCTDVWSIGEVTGLETSVKVEVDGMLWHVADLRPVPPEVADAGPAEPLGARAEDGDPVESVRPKRATRRPVRFGYD